MTLSGIKTILFGVVMTGLIAGCSGPTISETCDEPQAYQSVVAAKRIEVPDDLDPLDDFREMPVPEATGPERQRGGRCIEAAPSILVK